MIKIETKDISGLIPALYGARNPMDSWDRMDTDYIFREEDGYWDLVVGEADYELSKKLIKAGTDHRKLLRMICVWVDITAPLYWWKEFDTYKIGTVANSCSTMHTLHKKELSIDDFSHEHLDKYSMTVLKELVKVINRNQQNYVEHKDEKDKWWQMIQLLPSSFNQKRTVMLNYEVLRRMYFARKDHKLDEWRHFCSWIEGLDNSWMLTEE